MIANNPLSSKYCNQFDRLTSLKLYYIFDAEKRIQYEKARIDFLMKKYTILYCVPLNTIMYIITAMITYNMIAESAFM
jgi:hypothetical protein